MRNLKVGDRVRFTGDFLRATGAYFVEDQLFQTATVVALDHIERYGPTVVTVRDEKGKTYKTLEVHLEKDPRKVTA